MEKKKMRVEIIKAGYLTPEQEKACSGLVKEVKKNLKDNYKVIIEMADLDSIKELQSLDILVVKKYLKKYFKLSSKGIAENEISVIGVRDEQ